MASSVTLDPLVLTLTARPPREALQQWWQARQADPETAQAFTDDAPRTFAALRLLLHTGAYVFYLAQDPLGVPMGAMWLHDLVRDVSAIPRAGWLGTYVLPAHRGARTTQAMWLLMRARLEARGVRHIYIASHHANTRAHRVAERHLGFHPVGLFPAFARFGGALTDCVILSLHAEDTGAAWALAAERAHDQRTAEQESCGCPSARPLLASQEALTAIN
ncbi:MAG: GNAT family N-acetyltransferase [Candidatus Tectimicrobiota bacterium]